MRLAIVSSTLALFGACDTPPPAIDASPPPADAPFDAFAEPDVSLAPDGYVDPPCTTLLEDPDDGLITTWPEVALLVDDPTTETGQRLRFREADYPTLATTLGGYLPTLTEDLAEVDGFGINAEVVVQFGRHFDTSRLPTP